MISDVVTTKKSLTVEEKKRVLRSAPKMFRNKITSIKYSVNYYLTYCAGVQETNAGVQETSRQINTVINFYQR